MVERWITPLILVWSTSKAGLRSAFSRMPCLSLPPRTNRMLTPRNRFMPSTVLLLAASAGKYAGSVIGEATEIAQQAGGWVSQPGVADAGGVATSGRNMQNAAARLGWKSRELIPHVCITSCWIFHHACFEHGGEGEQTQLRAQGK